MLAAQSHVRRKCVYRGGRMAVAQGTRRKAMKAAFLPRLFGKKLYRPLAAPPKKARMAKALVAPALVCKALRPLFPRDLQNAFSHLPNLQKERFSTFFDLKTPCFCLFCTMKEKTRALLF